MEFVLIFETQNQSLRAVKLKDSESDEFERVFDLWQDVEYLENFFEENKADLKFYKLTVEEAVMLTLKFAKELQIQILEIQDSTKADNKQLNSHFLPLDDNEYKKDGLEKCKAYMSLNRKGWLRLYAIKVPENNYIFTGGAIKLTRKMQDRPHTELERQKLINCYDFLRTNGIFDEEGLNDL